jgi:hypothetical protein
LSERRRDFEFNFVWKHSSLGITPQAAHNGIMRWDQLAPGELDLDIWKNLEWIQSPLYKENIKF